MELIKERFSAEDIEQLVQNGDARPCNWGDRHPITRTLSAVYRGHVDIKTWRQTNQGLRVWLSIRVDTKDGVPWMWGIAFKIKDREVSETQHKQLRETAKRLGLKNGFGFSIDESDPRQSYYPGRVFQFGCFNEDPVKVVQFIRALEQLFGTIQ